MTFRIIIIFFLSTFLQSSSKAQDFIRGKEFYFAFPKPFGTLSESEDLNLAIHIKQINPGPLNVLIENSEGLISYNSYPTFAFPRLIHFPIEYCNDFESEQINNYGIHLVFSKEVVVRASEIANDISDATNLLPLESLGKEYIITNARGLDGINSNEEGRSQITIVATEDSTKISIIPTFNTLMGHPSDSILNITLNQSQMYEIQPMNSLVDISGTLIKSCHPIAVFCGTNTLSYPFESDVCCKDRTWSQLSSTKYLGKTYYTVPFLSFDDNAKSDYGLKITAMNNDTKIRFDGEEVASIDAGETYSQEVISTEKVIEANKPIQVAQFMHNSYLLYGGGPNTALGDASMFFVPPIEAQTTSVFLEDLDTETSAYQTGRNMINLIVKADDLQYFETSSGVIFGNPQSFSHDPNYVYINYALPFNDESIEIENPFGFQAYSYKLADAYSHVYNGEYSLEPYFEEPELPLPDTICINQTVDFEIINLTKKSLELYNYEWNFGNGDISNEYPSSYFYDESGTYELILKMSYQGCEVHEFTKLVHVIGESASSFSIEGKTVVGKNDDEIYTVPDALNTSTIEWKVDGGLRITSFDNSVKINWLEESGIIYATEITKDGCVGARDTLKTTIIDNEVQEGDCFGFYLLQPNPVSEVLQFTGGVDRDTEYTIRIFNSIGQLTDEQNKALTRGSTNISFDVSDYPSGVYFLNVDNGDCRETIKWVKMR